MNSVILIGRLTKKPELRYIPGSQLPVCNFTLAIDRPVMEGKEKQTDFIRITVFGKQAETSEKYLEKGRLAAVSGRIQTGSYDNKEGQRVYTQDVVANYVQFLDWAERKEEPEEPRERSQSMPEGFQALDDDDIPF
ncbi:MAG: single-stranded DNA-binding protein [Clostridiales bacterium]|nr:single-stranded DNA-binding protein [Clostridiales bacterium]